jgi:uncharacterized membrane protein required for colicin V production
MIFSIAVILLVALVAYIHYMQGLLSGLISAVLAVLAAMLAIGHYESLAETVSGGGFNDAAPGVCMLGIFVFVYLVGRIVLDKLVPGNVRLPHLVDSIGGAVCGAVAGVFATGVIAVAFQSMPFEASIFGYHRYPLVTEPRSVTVSTELGQGIDRMVINELKNDDLEKEPQALLLPVDDIVLGAARRLSSGGSLAGARPLASVHPDLLQEMFGQRVGVPPGARHSATNKVSAQVEVVGANVIVQPLKKTTGEFEAIYNPDVKQPLKAAPGKKLVSVTVMFKGDAADTDKVVRLSPGTVRIVTKSGDGWANNYPVGTVQLGQVWLAKPDTPIFINVAEGDRGAHFLFQLDDAVFVANPNARPGPGGKPGADGFALAPETFIEVKRVRLSLDDVPVKVGMPPEEKKFYPMRKVKFYKEDLKPGEQQPTASTDAGRTSAEPAAPTGGPTKENGWLDVAPLADPVLTVTTRMPVPVSAGGPESEGDVATAAVAGHLAGRKFDVLEIDAANPAAAVTELAKGGNTVTEFGVPEGHRMVQVRMTPRKGVDPWAWAEELNKITISDEANDMFPCNGVFALVTHGGTQKLFAKYNAAAALPSLPKLEGAEMKDVTLLFVMPNGKKAKELQYDRRGGGLTLEK